MVEKMDKQKEWDKLCNSAEIASIVTTKEKDAFGKWCIDDIAAYNVWERLTFSISWEEFRVLYIGSIKALIDYNPYGSYIMGVLRTRGLNTALYEYSSNHVYWEGYSKDGCSWGYKDTWNEDGSHTGMMEYKKSEIPF